MKERMKKKVATENAEVRTIEWYDENLAKAKKEWSEIAKSYGAKDFQLVDLGYGDWVILNVNPAFKETICEEDGDFETITDKQVRDRLTYLNNVIDGWRKRIGEMTEKKIENIIELINETKDGFDGFVSEFLNKSKKDMLAGLEYAKSAEDDELEYPVVSGKKIKYFEDLHRGLFDCSDSWYYANYYPNSAYFTDDVYYRNGCFEIENCDQDVVATCNTVDEVIDYLKQQLHLFLKNSVSDAEDRIEKYIEYGC